MSPIDQPAIDRELRERVKSELQQDFRYADRIMMILVLLHWIAVSTLTAFTYHTYSFGFLNGAILTFIAAIAYYYYRGTPLSRMIFGAVLVGFSAIAIQQHLGRIEFHFHIFVAIAFLTIYKDYKPAVTAGVVTTVYHLIGNYLQSNNITLFDVPTYVFNYGCGIDIVLLHAFFIVLEVTVIAFFIQVDTKRFISLIESHFHFKKLNETLEDQIEERTRQLLSAKEDAEAANKAKSSFLANMSHEIRTPLNAILGFIGILQEQEQDKEKSKYITTIKKSGESLIEIINDILDFAKVESGKLFVDRITVNPHEDFDNIGSLFFAKAEDMGLHFHLYIDPQLPKVILIDILRVRQVLTNLLSNAIKFTKSGGVVSLDIRYNSDHDTLFFSVKDSGIGIAKENHSKVFEAFTQEEDSTSRKYGGTGLGLSISVRLVELMGGKIELKSEPGLGSEFYFTIPIEIGTEDGFHVIPDVANMTAAIFYPREHLKHVQTLEEYLGFFGINKCLHPENIHNITPADGLLLIIYTTMYTVDEIQALLDKGHTIIMIKSSLNENYSNRFNGRMVIIDPPFTPSNIHDALMHLFIDSNAHKLIDINTITDNPTGHVLIAEDNDSNQYLMGVIMKSLHLKYTFANDGEEAVRIFKNRHYDLILMDENMPNMNGTQATRLILEFEQENGLKHTPIVALTANAIKGDRERFLAAGMDDYLSKPIYKDKLLAVLNHYLNSTPVADITTESTSTQSGLHEKYTDIQTLADTMGYDVEDVQIMVNMFIDKIDTQLQVLTDAVNTQDYDTIFKTAHAIKGSSGNLKLDEIYELSSKIDSAARESSTIDYQKLIDDLKTYVIDVKKMSKNRE